MICKVNTKYNLLYTPRGHLYETIQSGRMTHLTQLKTPFGPYVLP